MRTHKILKLKIAPPKKSAYQKTRPNKKTMQSRESGPKVEGYPDKNHYYKEGEEICQS